MIFDLESDLDLLSLIMLYYLCKFKKKCLNDVYQVSYRQICDRLTNGQTVRDRWTNSLTKWFLYGDIKFLNLSKSETTCFCHSTYMYYMQYKSVNFSSSCLDSGVQDTQIMKEGSYAAPIHDHSLLFDHVVCVDSHYPEIKQVQKKKCDDNKHLNHII